MPTGVDKGNNGSVDAISSNLDLRQEAATASRKAYEVLSLQCRCGEIYSCITLVSRARLNP